jgi:hypothetical protein
MTYVARARVIRTLGIATMPKAVKRLRPHVQHFFDTNFFLLDSAVLPDLGNVPWPRRWTTETVLDELTEKGREATARSVAASHQVLRFNDLYLDDANACPVFYAYIMAMYSPAVVGGESFYEELLLSRRIKGVSEDDEKRLYDRLRSEAASGHHQLPDGTSKPESLRRLERHDSATKKKIAATIRDGHPALIRDAKNLALSLYYCLRTKQNVVFYTADADPVSLLFRWLEAMSMRGTLVSEALRRLGEEGRVRVARDGIAKLVIPADEFIKNRLRWYKGIVYDSYKTSGCRFTIKRWDQKQGCFEDDIYLTFESEVADVLARAHDNMWCHFTKNDELGNWCNIVYEWPPKNLSSNELRIAVRSKCVNGESLKVAIEEHDRECLYRRTDAAGRLHEWTQFIWDREEEKG